jgi:integrase
VPGRRERTRYAGIYRLESGRFQCIYRANGRQRSQSFERLADARAFQAATKTALDRGAWTDPAGGKVLVWEWAEWWTDHRSVSPATTAKTRTLLDHYILPTFGNSMLRSIDPQQVRSWVRNLEGQGKARGTVQAAYKLLRQLMAEAVEADLIGRSPVRGVKLAAGPPAREPRALTTEEASRLLGALESRPWARTLVLFLLGSGCRWGEATGLRRQRVHLLRRPPMIEVAESLHEVNGHLQMGPPKTRSSLRTIPLPKVVADALAAHLPPNGGPADLVFTAPRGGPLRRTNFASVVWWPTIKQTRLDRNENDEVVGLHVHDLRSTYASVLENHGVPLAITAELLGHSGSGSITAGYTRAWQSTINEAVELVNRWLTVVVGGEEGRRVGG